jgi:hypothetical protein
MTDPKFPPENNLPAGYEPPKVWTWEPGIARAFASLRGKQVTVHWKKHDTIPL